MAKVPTVRIVFPHANGGEWATINESDFDPAKHELYVELPAELATFLADADPAMFEDDVSRETPAPRKRGRPRKDA
jgi:hypothetical protein